MSKNIEKQGEFPIETAPAEPYEVIRTVSTIASETVEQSPVETENEDVLWEASAPAAEMTGESQSFAGSAPIVAPQNTSRRDRKWTRRVEDLPRGERWKRRLPGVCR